MRSNLKGDAMRETILKTMLSLTICLFLTSCGSGRNDRLSDDAAGSAPSDENAESVDAGGNAGQNTGAPGSWSRNLPALIAANEGQTDPRAKFYAHGSGYSIFFTEQSVIVVLMGKEDEIAQKFSQTALALRFLNSQPDVRIEGVGENPGRVNYILGSDPSKWVTGVKSFDAVVYKELWPGIDMRFEIRAAGLKYEFVVQPGADAGSIRLMYEGADGTTIDEEGNLKIGTASDKLTDKKPVSYQEQDGRRFEVDSRFEISGAKGEFGFALGQIYNPALPVTIDPTVEFHTFLGGLTRTSEREAGNAIDVDSEGYVYVAGETVSPDFTTILGSYDMMLNASGRYDAFITKFEPDGSYPAYSTFLGGEDNDYALGIAVDSSGAAYVTGYTDAAFPTTSGAFNRTYFGALDAFITKLNPSGSALEYSALLGEREDDMGRAIAVDSLGFAYVAGHTNSDNFPVTSAAFQRRIGGTTYDAFVAKINPTASSIEYATFIGGGNHPNPAVTGNDMALGIAVDGEGRAYITGATDSPEFPTTPNGCCDGGGGYDAFISKFSPDGSSLLYSTPIGGTGPGGIGGHDVGHDIAIDDLGNAYITGYTEATGYFDPTPGVVGESFSGGRSDAFVSKVNTAWEAGDPGSSLIYNTYLGGNGEDVARGIGLEPSGNVIVVGWTDSPNFPLTDGAFIPIAYRGSDDVFITILNPDATEMLYSTYYGSTFSDTALGSALVNPGQLYVTGITFSPAFANYGDGYRIVYGGGGDAFVLHIDLFCGNGVLDADRGEECDDGNIVWNDGCSNACLLECGDGYDSRIEECDDGNREDGDGCSALCVLECGNDIVTRMEECDDGNRADGDGCSGECVIETEFSCGIGCVHGRLTLAGVPVTLVDNDCSGFFEKYRCGADGILTAMRRDSTVFDCGLRFVNGTDGNDTRNFSHEDEEDSDGNGIADAIPTIFAGGPNGDGEGERDYISLGSDADDLLIGGSGRDNMNGGDGNDWLCGGYGDDGLDGGDGDDIIYCGNGNDTCRGKAGNDTIRGGTGANVIEGNEGEDTLNGGPGPDLILGGNGNDFIDCKGGDDICKGGEGNDVINGGAGTDYCSGGGGSDTIDCGSEPDLVAGRSGGDTIDGCDGDIDTINGNGSSNECVVDCSLSGDPIDIVESCSSTCCP